MRIGKDFWLGALLLSLACGVANAASTAAVSGVVHDTQGVAQMGAMVQVLTAGSVSVATAFTDMYGRYRIANLVPGRYQVKASAALFVPAMRNNLQLSTGMRATVNLTLNMLSDPAAWLPAERRKPDEPGDDWTWTLRSAANRPILRILDDGEVVMVSSAEKASRRPVRVRDTATSGDGGFGGGGIHDVVEVDRAAGNGSDLMLRGNVAKVSSGVTPATEVDAGYERSSFAGGSRLTMSYASHPEMMSGGVMGLSWMRMASGEKMHLGDIADVEAGGTVYAIHTTGDAFTAQPFLRVTVFPGEVWAVQYRLATSRDVQSFEALNSIETDLPIAVMCHGQLKTESGTHQAIAVSRKAGHGLVQATLYHDDIDRSTISGMGATSAAGVLPAGNSDRVIVDTSTDSFRLLGAGYSKSGVSLAVSEPLTSSLWAALEFASGAALSTRETTTVDLPALTAGMHPEAGEALTAELKGRVVRTGTKVRTSYRWQPRRFVTAVAPYGTSGDQGYLSFYVRQAVRWGDKLPQGLEATIDVTNLLKEGYHPFLSADGRTLYLAQAPRTMQAGLSFTF
ncbi:MAG TPA: carboxypeptidase-like regulatory domain-containing protein [Acidobacteriaceae bacterium]